MFKSFYLTLQYSHSLGAMTAITRKHKSSLFSVGIKKVEGTFNSQQCVEICLYDENDQRDKELDASTEEKDGKKPSTSPTDKDSSIKIKMV